MALRRPNHIDGDFDFVTQRNDVHTGSLRVALQLEYVLVEELVVLATE
jgi:hypothetical protein